MSEAKSFDQARIATFHTFVEHATTTLQADERVRILWLTGSLVTGMADAQSDVDLRIAVRNEDFTTVGSWWQECVEAIARTVWTRRWPSPPNEAILGAITTDYLRFDLVVQSVDDTKPRTFEAVRLLFDKDGIAEHFVLTAPSQHDPYMHLSYVVEEFIRLLGMLPIVVERDDVPMGMEGQLVLHSLLISLLLMENGIDRAATGKRHVVALLNGEQRAILESVPSLAPTMESVIQGRLVYGRLFLPRAQRLMEARGLTYPTAFEDATRQHLKETLDLNL